MSSDDDIETPGKNDGVTAEAVSLVTESTYRTELNQGSSTEKQDQRAESGMQDVIQQVMEMGVVQNSKCTGALLVSEMSAIGKYYIPTKKKYYTSMLGS